MRIENLIFRALLLLFASLFCSGCMDGDGGTGPVAPRDYRQDMRGFVQAISDYARTRSPGFIVIPQNGNELITLNGEVNGEPALAYIAAISGVGREDLFYGFAQDNSPTPEVERSQMTAFLDIAESNSLEAVVTDYCWTQSYVDSSYLLSAARAYISFAADHRELDDIPQYPAEPYNVNALDVTALSDAKNFLYILNPGSFSTKDEFLSALRSTNYDLIIMDLFYSGTEELSPAEVASLKSKSHGGARLVISYMSIGEAEDYRYYWQAGWEPGNPAWLEEENPDWPGNFKVRYWDEVWQSLVFGNDSSYMKKIIDAGFDGVYLDVIDAFEYFEGG